jgi:hypothetical protein
MNRFYYYVLKNAGPAFMGLLGAGLGLGFGFIIGAAVGVYTVFLQMGM